MVNLEAGFKERVLYIDAAGTPPPACQSDTAPMVECLATVARYVGICTPISPSEYAGSKKGSKRTIYMRAVENLVHKPKTLREAASLAYFVKREATQHTKRQVPRVISPRSPEFNVLLGRFLHVAEPRIYEALQRLVGSDQHVIAKGLTQQEKAAVIVSKLQKFGCCVGLDASRFDQSIGRELLELEHGLYKQLFPGSRSLQALLRCQLTVEGCGRCPDGLLRYRGPAMRCSGDVNTSLGNCIISVVMAWCYLRQHGIAGDILCDGDDLLLFLSPGSLSLLHGLPAWYLGYGLRMKVEAPAFEPEQVEFCQSKPVFDGAEWVLCRNPSKAFNTDGFVPHYLGEREALVHMRAVGLCGLSLAAGMPMFDAFYDSLVAAGKTGRWDMHALGGICYQQRLQVKAGHTMRSRPVHPDCRMSFWRAFGVHPDEQIAMEALIRRCVWSQGSHPSTRRQLSGCNPSAHFFAFYPFRTGDVGVHVS